MRFTEKSACENYFLENLQQAGWKYIPGVELKRTDLKEPLLIFNLRDSLNLINQNLNIGEEEVNKAFNELLLTNVSPEGVKKVLNYFKFGIPIKFEKDRTVKYVQLFDYLNPFDNEFIISNQVTYTGRENIRNDIILFINGIPLVDIECKNPVSLTESWVDAYNQIKNYEKIIPELYKYINIGIAAENVARYFPIVPWQDKVNTNIWRMDEKDQIDSIIEMLTPTTLLDILRNFLFFRIERGEATKVITRYMQYYAANKVYQRIIDNLAGKDAKDKGLIWHWQGSGKTLTMAFASQKLYYTKELSNPSIFFIVDRTELEEQLSNELNALDGIAKPEIISSIAELKRIIKSDDYRGKRGVFITLIHKFSPEELSLVQKELETISQNKETLMNRKNVIALIDEGHRSQYGLMASQMRSLLKSAFFFAFTGTPISKNGKDTFITFSNLPDELYLDRYFIYDSIKDNFTVKIAYQPRLEQDVHLDKELLETFLKSELEEIPENLKNMVENQIKEKLNNIKLILENPHRIAIIATDIAQHYKNNFDDRFKALVVAGSRLACAIYKKELDKHLPEEYSKVVMTYTKNDKPIIQEIQETMELKYHHKDLETINKDLTSKFKEEAYPKILIVTDMLLTGFDAPNLGVLYLDKLLKEHRLLQAIARTNRPYKDLKEAGLVVDYIGVFQDFKKALEIYNELDMEKVLIDINSLKEEFGEKLMEILSWFEGVSKEYDRRVLIKALKIITSNEQLNKEFPLKYRELRKIFELLGSDESKIQYLDDYMWLTCIYQYYLKMVVQQPEIKELVDRYFQKTIQYAHETTKVDDLIKDIPIIVFGDDYLKRLEDKFTDMESKTISIIFMLNKLILVDKNKKPIYESLADRVERLLHLWKERTLDYEALFREGASIAQSYDDIGKRQKILGLSDMEYFTLITLEKIVKVDEEVINSIRTLKEKINSISFTGWSLQTTVKKEVEKEIRLFCLSIMKKFGLTYKAMDGLHKKLFEGLLNYGFF